MLTASAVSIHIPRYKAYDGIIFTASHNPAGPEAIEILTI